MSRILYRFYCLKYLLVSHWQMHLLRSVAVILHNVHCFKIQIPQIVLDYSNYLGFNYRLSVRNKKMKSITTNNFSLREAADEAEKPGF